MLSIIHIDFFKKLYITLFISLEFFIIKIMLKQNVSIILLKKIFQFDIFIIFKEMIKRNVFIKTTSVDDFSDDYTRNVGILLRISLKIFVINT